tara:strand:+ start:322 stop:492 length:171 start_codon:yes stop_codon:yes gene_type:complete
MTQVISIGGSIGSKDRVVKEFENHDEAKLYAKSMRKHLSRGEREYYKMSYIVKKVK